MDKNIKILAIESSCDETAASVVEDGVNVLSNVIYSQIDIHTEYGGVVPEIASRAHMEKINPVVDKSIKDAGICPDDLDAVAVTFGPGLVGSLLVGVSFAKAYAYALGLPLIGVNHISGHICANYIEHPGLKPPYGCLVVSGGHTHLVRVADYGVYEVIGRTMDDAAGEAFDKVARAIGLGYPGGPKIQKAAQSGNPSAIDFPRGKIEGSPYDFSFSGLKSAVLNYLNGLNMKGQEYNRADVAASFQACVVEMLVSRARLAIREFGFKDFAIAGGVSSNSAFRSAMEDMCKEEGVAFYKPSPVLCTDNAAMIGAAAYHEYIKGNFSGLDLNAVPGLKLA